MAEIWDIYDEFGEKTGRTMKRGEPQKGEYMLCVHVYLYTPEKMFLIQKRATTKESHPGVWDVTGGAVLAGEESIHAAIRETYEELGIKLSESSLRLIKRIRRRRNFADIYFAEKAFALSDCILQTEEVAAVRLVDGEELLHIAREERGREDSYMKVISQALTELEA